MTGESQTGLGVALRQAWVGYRRRLDDELAEAGFGDRGFPDGRVLSICATASDVTISSIGRELGITRQGASKLVASLRARGYVTLRPSGADAREKLVALTPRARTFLRVQQEAAGRIERRVASELGAEALDVLRVALGLLGGDHQPRLRDYLQESRKRGGATSLRR
jgi:DNA-binding MarR family transcriptional regulator